MPRAPVRLSPVEPDTRSPQHDLIDEFLWSRLSAFWSRVYSPEDKDALNAMYEALMRALDAEYLRLFEINAAKSIETCPIFSQRRWLRLDLHRYEELKAWLRFLQTGAGGAIEVGEQAALSANSDVLSCSSLVTNHARHWHIHFPWQIDGSLTDVERRTMQLSLPLVPSQVAVWQMVSGSDGVLRGIRLLPDRDFEVLADGTSIRLATAAANQIYEVDAAVDLSGSTYQNLRPRVALATQLPPRTLIIPDEMSLGLPVHVLVVRKAPLSSAAGLTATNRTTYETRRIFIPYTGDSTGVRHGGVGRLILPNDFTLQSEDVVQVFGFEVGDFDTLHTHIRDSRVMDLGSIGGSSMAVYTPGAAIQRGIFGSVGFLSHELRLFINGRLLSPNDYRYDLATNLFTFRVPPVLPSSGQILVDVQFSSQTRASQSTVAGLHLHFQCQSEFVSTATTFETFDDGSTFDDEDTEVAPFFDSSGTTDTIYLDTEADLATLVVYLDGVLARIGTDYFASNVDGRTRLVFSVNIEGRSILLTFRRDSRVFSFGSSDITGGAGFTFTPETLSGVLNDLQGVVEAFKATYNTSIRNLAALIEAAQIAANGGNPLLTLFFDEFPEYRDLPINAAGVEIRARDLRKIESADTQLIALPFLTDHVLNPTIRLEEGVDFQVINGEIQASRDLTAPRSDSDTQPGVWWCPVVVLDEHLLAKNFGALVADQDDSGLGYRDALVSNLRMRFGGAAAENIERSAAVMLGSPMFTQDSRIVDVRSEVQGYLVTIDSLDGTQQQVAELAVDARRPAIDQAVYPGLSIGSPLLVDRFLSQLEVWSPGRLVVNEDLGHLREGDQARIQLFDPDDPLSDPIWTVLSIISVDTTPILGGTRTALTFAERPDLVPTSQSRLRVFRDEGPPYAAFEGTVTAVTPRRQVVIETESESFLLPPGALVGYRRGDVVYRGWPVRPDLATLYDDVSRPRWHWLKPEHVRSRWGHLGRRPASTLRADGLPDQRRASLNPPVGGGYTRCTLAPVTPHLPRGTLLRILRDDGTGTEDFRVIGQNGSETLVLPLIQRAFSGLAEVVLADEAFTKADDEYFELPPDRASGSRPTTALAIPQKAGTAALAVVSTTAFSAAGRLVLRLPAGGMIEVEYFSKIPGQFLDLVWPKEFPALIDDTGVLRLVLETSIQVVQVARYEQQLLNPPFIELVRKRVDRDHGTVTGEPTITAQNADQYYALFRTNAAVLETATASRPQSLRTALADVLPAGTTLVTQSRHSIADVFEPQAADGAFADQHEVFHPMVLAFTSPGLGVISGTELHIAANATEVVLGISVTDPDGQTPYVFAWSIQVIRQPTATLQIVDPTHQSTRLVGLAENGEYQITCTVRDDRGQEKSATVVLLVDA